MPLDMPPRDEEPGKPGAPIPQAQPDTLAALAALRGMTACDVEQASVLELACGDGSNLLPLAERHPGTRFLGIDDSQSRIEQARDEARALGLENVEFGQGTLRELGSELGLFDYLLAGGMYSWSGAAMADKVLAICRDHLAPRGIAYVSYLVHPGWQVHELLGSMMRYEVGGARSAAEQVAAGRMLLEFLKACLPVDDQPYPALLRAELDRLSRQPDAHLQRNYLNPDCAAVYFHEFIVHARSHRLQLLGDCSVGARLSDTLPAPVERELQMVTPNPIAREQARDLVRNRALRESLLCHEAVALESAPDPSRLRGLYLEGRLRMVDAQGPIESSEVADFVAPGGLSISTSVPVVKAALQRLGEAWPGYVPFDELVAEACQRIAGATSADLPAPDVDRLKQNLLQCCSAGVVNVHAARSAFVPLAGERPTASPLARRQAARGAPVTNRKHESLQLDTFDRHLFHLLDGTRSVDQLVEHLAAAAAAGHMLAVENGQPVPPERLREFLRESLAQSLKRLSDNAYLIA